MFKNKQRLSIAAVALALLTAAGLWGVLLTGAALAQSAQPNTPGPGWHHGMMGGGMMGGGMMGHGMMGHGMTGCGMTGCGMMGQSLGTSAAVTDTLGAAQAGVPASFTAAIESADAERGKQLTLATGCVGCHSLDPNQAMVGPTWHNLAETAAARVEGENAAEYLYTSIAQPNAYVVQGYQPTVMIQGYGQTLGEQDLAAIVKYLLTLRG